MAAEDSRFEVPALSLSSPRDPELVNLTSLCLFSRDTYFRGSFRGSSEMVDANPLTRCLAHCKRSVMTT